MPAELEPFRLSPWFSERVWGRPHLRPWYQDTGTDAPVGEAWLTGPESVVDSGPLAGRTLAHVVKEHPHAVLGGTPASEAPEFPLLVKLLFPEEKLSVQVHPDDTHARSMGQPRGKTECWYVLEATPGAAVALGIKPGCTPEHLRASIADGTMEDLMQWLPVSVGDMIFVDAGTVHAIGPGMVLLETQQTSDTTFRMYDYGRPRELHVEQGLRVMKSQTAAGKVLPQPMDGFTRLIEQRYFTVDRYDLPAQSEAVIPASQPACLVCLGGSGVILTATGSLEMLPGRAVIVPASGLSVTVETAAGISFVRCSAPPVR